MAHSLSPRMHNAAFAALGLDWEYIAWEVESHELETVLERLAGLGYAGANVTAPYKRDVARLAGSREESVNTLLFDPLRATSTDAAILEGLEHERAVIVGDGGAAAAFRAALPDAQVFSRRGEWPPETAGVDLVVNATSARDEVVVQVVRGQTLVDLPYPDSATAAAARAAGARVLDGLEVLVAQG
ncbi:MAG TPA: hypothetical protein VHK46_02295, partial [Gaiellaceae bacterium]|nr:hypothetical protein [Gaiellaceae bacterium]